MEIEEGPLKEEIVGEITNSDAIHPGYGFLAENAEFSKICEENGFAFIGPNSDIINSMGDKAQAKKTMSAAGVPIIPGNEGILKNAAEAKALAKEMGYPVMLKASAGGGGRGMRLVHEEKYLEQLYTTASNEALTAFNNGNMYIEKFIENPRHIEIQILADSHGNVVSLGERECSIQRRHQKLYTAWCQVPLLLALREWPRPWPCPPPYLPPRPWAQYRARSRPPSWSRANQPHQPRRPAPAVVARRTTLGCTPS